MEDRQWHTLTVEETLSVLETSPSGLELAEAERRLAEVGPNEIESAHKVSALTILWAQIKNPLVFVLLAAAAVSLVAGKTADAIVIAVVIVVNSLIGFLQEYRAEAALEALKVKPTITMEAHSQEHLWQAMTNLQKMSLLDRLAASD